MAWKVKLEGVRGLWVKDMGGWDKHEAEGNEKVGTLVVAKLVKLAALAFAAIAEAEGSEALLGLVGSGAKCYWER